MEKGDLGGRSVISLEHKTYLWTSSFTEADSGGQGTLIKEQFVLNF